MDRSCSPEALRLHRLGIEAIWGLHTTNIVESA